MKAALTVTARPVGPATSRVDPTRAGAGLARRRRGRHPARPPDAHRGLVRPREAGLVRRSVRCGSTTQAAASGAWTATFEPDQAAGGSTRGRDRPGDRPGDAGARSSRRLRARRDRGRRRPSPGRRDPPDPGLGPRLRPAARRGAAPRSSGDPGLRRKHTRARGACRHYRYPEVPDGSIVTSLLRGPEQVFRVVLPPPGREPRCRHHLACARRARRAPAGRGRRREPPDRLRGPPVRPQPVRRRVRETPSSRPVRSCRRRGRTPSSSTARAAPGAGKFRFRFWVDDTTPPHRTTRRTDRRCAASDPVPRE